MNKYTTAAGIRQEQYKSNARMNKFETQKVQEVMDEGVPDQSLEFLNIAKIAIENGTYENHLIEYEDFKY